MLIFDYSGPISNHLCNLQKLVWTPCEILIGFRKYFLVPKIQYFGLTKLFFQIGHVPKNQQVWWMQQRHCRFRLRRRSLRSQQEAGKGQLGGHSWGHRRLLRDHRGGPRIRPFIGGCARWIPSAILFRGPRSSQMPLGRRIHNERFAAYLQRLSMVALHH